MGPAAAPALPLRLAPLARIGGRTGAGALRLEVVRLRWWTVLRWAAGIAGITAALAGAPLVALVLVVVAELVGRWLFFVAVVPLNMPGSFWRGTVTGNR